MADSNKRQQSGAKKPGRPKGSTSSKSGTSSKSNTSSRGGTSSRGRAAKEPEIPEEQNTGFMRAEVVIICSFAVAILLFLSNFRLCGFVGEALRSVQLGVFGMLGYLVPVLLFVGTCFHLSNQGNVLAVVKLAAVIALVPVICGFLHLLFGGTPEEAGWSQFYLRSSLNGAGGGWLGGVLASLLIMAVGRAGAYLVLIVLFIICMVCITERSFISAVRKGGDRAYQYAREDIDRRREVHAQKTEERRRLREEQKVRGVDLEATRLSAPAEYDEEEFDREFGAELEQIPEEGTGKIPEKNLRKRDRIPDKIQKEDEELQNQFRGNISLPPGYDAESSWDAKDENGEDDPGALARSIEKHRRPDSRAVVTGMTFEDENGVHDGEEYVTIRASRDSRTLEEMEMSGPVSFEEDLRTASLPVSGKKDDEVPWEEVASETATASETPPVSKTVSAPGKASASDPLFVQEPSDEQENKWDARIDDTYGGNAGINTAYRNNPSEQGINYDSVFVPEEPKRVVTASGKVIETETELLQKKIEKKRSEAAADNEVSVAEEIKEKEEAVKKEYVFPPVSLLKKPARPAGGFSQDEYKATAIKLQQTLHNFGVGVTVTNISCGPSVTRYELLPEQGVKVSKIVTLADDIKLSLAAADIRIEAPIPGKSAVGIEVPNKENNTVYLRELLESEAFINHKSRLAFAVGKDIGGQVVVTDIAKMPHLLIAGATGSGKSVCINTLIMSIIFKSKPDDVRLIMVDPKVVELSVYNGIPHLLIPVVTDPKKASGALNWAVAEMMDRYKKFAECNVRDVKGYNERVEKLGDIEDEKKPVKLPQIVIIIDELADLMMVAPGEVEDAICRLAQLARAAGIHLVIATQRPSVNVITGLIKANVPSRIAFAVSSGVDSRTIIDMNGAEKLLGKGDMLFYPAGFPKPQRVQGAFVSDEEVGRVVEFLTEQGMSADYSPEVESRLAGASADSGSGSSSRDEYFVQAGQFIIEKDKASIGMLQRMFKIGFNRAARIMDQLAEAGVVGEEEGTKPRKVLMSMEQFEEMLEQGR